MKKSAKALEKELEDFRIKTKALLSNLKYPLTRQVARVSAADEQGKLNGMTIVELLTMVNMADTTNERVVLRTSYDKKTLIIELEKKSDVIISSL